MADKFERVAAQLRDRLAQMVAQYEVDLALVRDDAAEQIAQLQEKINELEKDTGNVSEKETNSSEASQ